MRLRVAILASFTARIATLFCAQSGDQSAGQATTTPVFHVVYNLGTNPGDPENMVYPGVLAEGPDGNIYGTSAAGGANGAGTIFKVTPSGNLTVLYNFDVTHGSAPQSGLTLGTDGNFYGSTMLGGSGYGTVFKVTTTGTLSVLHTFTNGNDGGMPYAAPIQGSDGSFYGTTTSGGADGFGTVYRITSAGSLTTIHTFAGGYSDPSAPLLEGKDGNFYGTTFYGGTNGTGTVFSISPSGAFQVIYNFGGVDGSQPFASLVQANDGNLYGVTSLGGSRAQGLIFSLKPSGAINLLYNFGSQQLDARVPYGNLIQAADGNFYGTTVEGGSADGGALFQLTPEFAYSIIVNFVPAKGQNPQVPLLQHSNGLLYGATNYGGTANKGTIYSLKLPSPSSSTLARTSADRNRARR